MRIEYASMFAALAAGGTAILILGRSMFLRLSGRCRLCNARLQEVDESRFYDPMGQVTLYECKSCGDLFTPSTFRWIKWDEFDGDDSLKEQVSQWRPNRLADGGDSPSDVVSTRG